MHKSPILSTYLFGLESSLVVDIGAEFTHVVPVYEGFIHWKGIMRAPIGGETITRELAKASLKNSPYKNTFSNQDKLTPAMNNWSVMVLMQIFRKWWDNWNISIALSLKAKMNPFHSMITQITLFMNSLIKIRLFSARNCSLPLKFISEKSKKMDSKAFTTWSVRV